MDNYEKASINIIGTKFFIKFRINDSNILLKLVSNARFLYRIPNIASYLASIWILIHDGYFIFITKLILPIIYLYF